MYPYRDSPDLDSSSSPAVQPNDTAAIRTGSNRIVGTHHSTTTWKTDSPVDSPVPTTNKKRKRHHQHQHHHHTTRQEERPAKQALPPPSLPSLPTPKINMVHKKIKPVQLNQSSQISQSASERARVPNAPTTSSIHPLRPVRTHHVHPLKIQIFNNQKPGQPAIEPSRAAQPTHSFLTPTSENPSVRPCVRPSLPSLACSALFASARRPLTN